MTVTGISKDFSGDLDGGEKRIDKKFNDVSKKFVTSPKNFNFQRNDRILVSIVKRVEKFQLSGRVSFYKANWVTIFAGL